MVKEDNVKDKAREFLLAEFAALQERAMAREEGKANRINFFLVAVAAIVGGVSIVLESSYPQSSIVYGILIASFLILVLGIATLDQVVKYSVELIFFYRVAGRIRKYFADSCQEIAPYVAFYPTDSRPTFDIGKPYVALRGGDAVLLSVNALAASIMTGVVADLLLKTGTPFVYVAIMGLTFVAVWQLQIARVRFLLRDAKKIFAKHIRFPKDEKHKVSISERGGNIGNDLLTMANDSEIQQVLREIEE